MKLKYSQISKKKVLFVGSFKDKAKDGSVGGQMYASRSLIQSELAESIEWVLLDTTGESVPPPPVHIRLFHAIKRMLNFVWVLIFRTPDSVLIFCANTPSIYEKGTMAIIASFFRLKVILAPRGGPLDQEIENSNRLKNFVAYVFKRVDFIVCQGAYWKTFFSAILEVDQHKKFIVIPNWIDITKYDINQTEVDKTEGINVLYMGWIQEDKGVYDIFDAIDQMKDIREKVNFYFLGDGPARTELMRVSDSGKYPFTFHFPGWVHGNAKMEYLTKADVFVLASHSEGLPNSLMEAMGCGIASIASNVGSVSDLIIDGETGILIEKKAVADLASGLTRLIRDKELREKLSFNGKKRIIDNHSIVNAVVNFKKIL